MIGNPLANLHAAALRARAAMRTSADGSAAADLHRTQLLILAVLGIIGASFAAWATLVPLEGAVVAQGQIIVESNIKKVQHPTGGVIGEIRVREGQQVQAGDVVVRLDDTQTKANLSVIRNEQIATRLRLARLVAERDERGNVVFPPELNALVENDAELASLKLGEERLFRSRKAMRDGQRAQLLERIKQIKQDIEGMREQLEAARTRQVIARNELDGLAPLRQKALVPSTRISALEREIAQNSGAIGELVSKVFASEARVIETELQIIQLGIDLAAEVSRDFREATTKLGELQERATAAEDQLRRVDIRAPIAGAVLQLAVHTVNGVIGPSETLMMIVPDSERLLVEGRIQPTDIDQMHIGQHARVRLSAFNQRTTPEIHGEVVRVGGDISKDPQTGALYYTAGVRVPEGEIARLRNLKLVPGMPADLFIRTTDRTMASFLLKPFLDQMQRAFRED